MIDTIIFDIGNVLAGFCWQDSFQKVLNETEYDIISNATVLDEDKWGMMDKGEKSYEKLLDYYSLDFPHLKEKMNQAFMQVYKDIIPFDYSCDWINSYKERGFKVYILSNYGKKPFEVSKPRFDFLKLTDGGVISYEVKMLKPNHDIFGTICDKYSIVPQNAIFIDDSAKNVSGAISFGLNAVLFESFEQAKKDVEKIILQ